MSMSKSFYYCGHCDKLLGWKFGNSPHDTAYCFACEATVTEMERVRQIEYVRYRAMARQS